MPLPFCNEDKFRLYSPRQINGYTFNSPILEVHLDDYKKAINLLGQKYNFIAETFHSIYPEPPYTIQGFLDFMKSYIGLGVTVTSFDGTDFPRFGGTWYWDDDQKKDLIIWVNSSHSKEKQKMTVIHECVHAIQDFDREFIEELSTYPLAIQCRIADRIAEKAAVEILLPRKLVSQDKLAGAGPDSIAAKYQVSRAMALIA
jgi:hypothetical protein